MREAMTNRACHPAMNDGAPTRTTSFLVIKDHASEFPDPIRFERGALLVVGETYDGPEGWADWHFCETPGRNGGWVPAQVIEFQSDGTARAAEDYTARELDVKTGEVVVGSRVLNGWVWCERPASTESGWVPLDNLRQVE